jgi:hypothetical protein
MMNVPASLKVNHLLVSYYVSPSQFLTTTLTFITLVFCDANLTQHFHLRSLFTFLLELQTTCI